LRSPANGGSRRLARALRLLATLPFEAPSEPSKTSLAIVTAHREDRLIALWPLVLVGSGGLKLVRWMGEPVSQYGEVLIAMCPTKPRCVIARHRHRCQLR
jgi:CelD/BcsL family acetyltransferase involved in cellulose biosynthesis